MGVPTCKGFTCPKGQKLIGDDVVCATGHCCAKTCCEAVITTVTTTPAPCCDSFTCPSGYKNYGHKVICAAGHCNKATCCHELPPPCTTITTTPVPTCKGFTCPDGQKLIGDDVVCANGHCCAKTCCKTEIITVTTTPAPLQCTSYTCPAGYHNLGAIDCKNNHCCAHDCCAKDTTAAPPNPCTTIAPARKYDSKQSVLVQQSTTAEKKSGATATWALPLLGVVAMFSLAAFVAVRAKRSYRSTRQAHVGLPQTDENDDLPFLSDDGPVE